MTFPRWFGSVSGVNEKQNGVKEESPECLNVNTQIVLQLKKVKSKVLSVLILYLLSIYSDMLLEIFFMNLFQKHPTC